MTKTDTSYALAISLAAATQEFAEVITPKAKIAAALKAQSLRPVLRGSSGEDHMSQTFTFTTHLYRGRNEREHEVEVTYTVTPGTPARLYGDYPHPEEPSEIEVTKVVCINSDFDTTAEEDEILHDEACDRADEHLADAAADEADYRYEQLRDERNTA